MPDDMDRALPCGEAVVQSAQSRLPVGQDQISYNPSRPSTSLRVAWIGAGKLETSSLTEMQSRSVA
ncbi:hypothetical protein GTW23_22115 [Hoeflea alexandrii]|uniref:Uncharacterized protein n=1 Tax=Hoeflea alexandrii TaxID=288436 RepID=A0ABT1CXG7_9HYPH|nr:hypothetical protein [Hoeflea alexandrii]